MTFWEPNSFSYFNKPPAPPEPRDYYISSSTGDDSTGDGTIGNPYASFDGAGLDTPNALNPGDNVYFKAGDTWLQKEVQVNSNGTANSPITLGRYGEGDDPLFIWANVVDSWTYSGANNIYYKTGITGHPGVVGIDGTHSICQWTGSTTVSPATITNLLPGTYRYRADTDTLYIRLDTAVDADPDPNNHTIYVPTTLQSNIFRGVISGGAQYGRYTTFNNFNLKYPNGVGYSLSQSFGTMNNCHVLGAGRDGFLTVGFKSGGELADYAYVYGCSAKWCDAAVGGGDQPFTSGGGQGFTMNSPYSWFDACLAEFNWMAGIDALDYSTADTEVHHGGFINCISRNNGRWTSDPSYDPGMYLDGCHDFILYNNIIEGAGTGTGDGANARAGLAFGSEHELIKPVYNIYVINNLISNNKGVALNCKNLQTNPPIRNIKNIWVINNTIIAKRSGYNEVFSPGYLDPEIEDSWVMKNNILYCASDASASEFLNDNNLSLYATLWDANNNLWFRHGGSTNILKTVQGTNYTVATWNAATGHEADSVYGDPRFINNTEGSFNVRLQRTSLGQANDSPGIGMADPDPWTPPSWVAESGRLEFDGYVHGTTRSDDAVTSTPQNTVDVGYHYHV